jgi:hypothetical protein
MWTKVRRGQPAMLLVCAASVALWGCSPGAGSYVTPAGSSSTIPGATCGRGDHPETGLQGQVPAPLRRPGGFSGFSCNLTLVAEERGDGAGWQAAFATQGLRAWDLSNPFLPREVGYYISPPYLCGQFTTSCGGGPAPVNRHTREEWQDTSTGLIYMTDGNGGGLTVLRWTGPIPPNPPIPGAR